MENPISPEQINILLVDDRPENIAALEAELAPLGHNLVGVNSGKAALRETLARDFAAIILDVVMPEMDGYETARMLKTRDKSQNIPIIFVTASSDEPVKGYAVGAVDYIFKPFNPEILRAKVRAFVEMYIAKEELDVSKTLVEKARDELEARVRERTADLYQEIGNRIRVENALRESEARYRAILETANDAIICMNPAGKVYIWNKKAEDLFGYAAREADGRDVHELIVPEKYRDPARTGLAKFSAAGEGPVINKTTGITALHRDGSEFPIDLSVAAVKMKNGWGASAIIRDITERKRRERELNETNQKLQQALDVVNKTQKMLVRQEKLAAMGQLSAGVAHELKNPLNIIYTSIQLMMMEEGLPAETAESCKIIMEQIMRAVKIIDNLRDFAREKKPETKEMDLCPFIEKTLSLVAYEMNGEGIEIAREFPPEPIRIMGDEDQLAQVFLNITNNARDSMNMRKKSYSFDEAERIGWNARFTVRTQVEGGKANISFEDNGVGIPEECKKKLFTPFFTTKGETTGTGLGIAIALGIIENHGGTIEFESEEGKGAVFEVTLPLAGG